MVRCEVGGAEWREEGVSRRGESVGGCGGVG